MSPTSLVKVPKAYNQREQGEIITRNGLYRSLFKAMMGKCELKTSSERGGGYKRQLNHIIVLLDLQCHNTVWRFISLMGRRSRIGLDLFSSGNSGIQLTWEQLSLHMQCGQYDEVDLTT